MSSTPSTTRLAVEADLLQAMAPCAYATAENVISGTPNESDFVQLTSADGKFTIGSWRADPHVEVVEGYGGDEYTRVIEGRITLTDTDGTVHSYGPGEAFTIAAGWCGQYRVEEPTLKQFAFYTP